MRRASSSTPAWSAAFGRFAGGFWRAPRALSAWALTLGLAAFLLLSTARHRGPEPLEPLVLRQPGGARRRGRRPVRAGVRADHRRHGRHRRRHRADARDAAGALARLDRGAARRPLARQAALLSPQRHRQGAAQPRVPHLRRHALGHRAAGRSRHRPAARRWSARPPSSASCGRVGGSHHLRSWARRRRSPSPPTWCGWRWPTASSPRA